TGLQRVPAARRGRYLGFVTVVMGTSPAIGPPLSGLIVDGLGWRGIFMVLLPIGVLALAVGAVKLRDQNTPTPVPIDGWSVLAAALAFGGLVYGINAIGEGHAVLPLWIDRKSTRLNSSHVSISYAVFCLKKKRDFGDDRID